MDDKKAPLPERIGVIIAMIFVAWVVVWLLIAGTMKMIEWVF